MELIVVRHGRPEHIEPENLDEGVAPADPPLAEVGHRQAERVGEELAGVGIDVVVSSPLQRALQTAAPLARHLGVEPVIVDGVAEYDRHESSYVPGEVTRQRIKDGLVDDAGADSWRDPLSGLSADEKAEWTAGVVDGFREIAVDNPGRRVAVFCHGMVTSVWFAHLLGIDDTVRFVPDYASISRVLASSSSDATTIRSFNETRHLGETHIPLFEA
ncbi:MAG: histidine phosphatase family protein [Actinomycetota bacterium]